MQGIINYLPIKAAAAIGGASCLTYQLAYWITPQCSTSTSRLSDYLCIRAAKFIDPAKIAQFFNPIESLRVLVTETINPYLPNVFPLRTSDMCPSLLKSYGVFKEYKDVMLAQFGNNPSLLNKITTEEDRFSDTYDLCCVHEKHFFDLANEAFSEELIYRVGIQKIGLTFLSHLLPKRIGTFVAHPISRVFVTSFIFALAHQKHPFVVSQLISGLFFGFIFEKYGLFASTLSHAIHNTLTYQLLAEQCKMRIAMLSR